MKFSFFFGLLCLVDKEFVLGRFGGLHVVTCDFYVLFCLPDRGGYCCRHFFFHGASLWALMFVSCPYICVCVPLWRLLCLPASVVSCHGVLEALRDYSCDDPITLSRRCCCCCCDHSPTSIIYHLTLPLLYH